MASGENIKLSTKLLHQAFLNAMGTSVTAHSAVTKKPFEVDLLSPYPPKLRIYAYNATFPPGGRTMGEHKIQLIIPGQGGGKGNFDITGGRIPLLLGYRADIEIFILWDAELYVDFAYSRNVQVMPETVYHAFANGFATQRRHLWTQQTEIVVTADARHLGQALLTRQRETLNRLTGGSA
jgi:hypothetical protein